MECRVNGRDRGGKRECATNRVLKVSYHPFSAQLSTTRGLKLPIEQPGGLEQFLKVGRTLVLIGRINQTHLERAVESLKRRQLFERVQTPMIATIECREHLPLIKQRLRVL